MHPSRTNLPRLLATGLILLGAASLALGYTYILNDTDPPPIGTGLPIKWPAPPDPNHPNTPTPYPIVMQVMADNTTKLSDGHTRAGALVAAMTDATRGWNQYLGSVQFAPTILVPGTGADGNNINEVFFSNSPYDQTWDSSTLAVTTVWYIGNERVEADTIFNTAFTWDSYRGPLQANKEDIERVALHEFGHSLGLDHPDDAGQTVTAIMNSKASNLDTLATDDITGAQNLYGPPGAPPNDNFARATAIKLSGNQATVNGYNTNATKETGEPNHAGNSGGHSVWWKWTAPSAGNVSLDTKGSYSDTTLGVYTGSTVSSLTAIASNDDITLGVVQASLVTFTATAGTTYYFAVDGYDNDDGNGADSAGLTLNLNFTSTGPSIPVITTQPGNATVTSGGSVTFSVVATGAQNYQWSFNNTAIVSATGASYMISSATSANAGNYAVTVTNSVGSVVSDSASLTVNAMIVTPPPSSGGGGGGGGAPSLWYLSLLSLLALGRRLCRNLRTET